MLFSLYFVMLFLGSLFMSSFQNLFIFSILSGLFLFLMGMFSSKFLFFGEIYIDYLSVILSVLSFFIILFMILVIFGVLSSVDLLMFYFLFFSLLMVFFSNSLLSMYFFIEISLLPLVGLLLMKGGSPERFKANIYMFLYTFLSSMFMLLGLLSMDKNMFVSLSVFSYFLFNYKGLIWLVMILIFIIKMPLYSLHLWLPKAHLEAPVVGSMILAGVLLKLGCFGILRLFMFLNFSSLRLFLILMVSVSLMGAFLVSLICLRQLDVKSLIAYSSVSHMGILFSGLLSLSKLGLVGSVGMMLAHGFCSSCLFFMSNLLYENFKSRNLFIFKGVIGILPLFIVFWAMFAIISMGTPPFFSFFCELWLIFSIFKKSFILLFVLGLVLFFSVFYSLSMFLRVGHGFMWKLMNFYIEVPSSMLIIVSHFLFLLLFMFKISLFITFEL